MINIKEGQWATVFRAEDKGKYVQATISTARKDKRTDEYINSNWFCRFVGKALDQARGLSDKDRIEIKNAAIENIYDKEKKRSYLNVVIFEFEMQQPKEKVEDGFIPVAADDDLLPF